MTKEEIELLVSLLQKSSIEDRLVIYDDGGEKYETEWCYEQNGKVYIRIKEL